MTWREIHGYGSSCGHWREPVGHTTYDVIIEAEGYGRMHELLFFEPDGWYREMTDVERDAMTAAWGAPAATSPAARTVLSATVWAWWPYLVLPITLVAALMFARLWRRSRTVPR